MEGALERARREVSKEACISISSCAAAKNTTLLARAWHAVSQRKHQCYLWSARQPPTDLAVGTNSRRCPWWQCSVLAGGVVSDSGGSCVLHSVMLCMR